MSQGGLLTVTNASSNVSSVTGTNGVTVSPTTGNVVVSGVNATTSTVGVASFNPAEFTVSGGGEVSLIGGSAITTITGNDSVPESPSAGNFNIVTANSTVLFTGTAATETLDFGLTNLLLGVKGSSISSGTENVGTGRGVLNAVSSGTANTGGGYHALLVNTTGSSNVAIGAFALEQNLSSSGNVAIGQQALDSLLSGTGNNTAVGISSLDLLQGGQSNIAIGNSAGNGYLTTESSNIVIGNAGTATESNVIRIGTSGSGTGQQNACYIAGITGVTVSNRQMVTINSSTGQLGVASSSQAVAYTNVTNAMSPYTVLATDSYISVDCSGGAVTLNFPNAPTADQTWTVKDRTGNSATNNITITTPGGTVTFDGSTSYVMDANYSAIQLLANATPTYEVF